MFCKPHRGLTGWAGYIISSGWRTENEGVLSESRVALWKTYSGKIIASSKEL